jgi:hypothetical protein
MTNDDDLFRWVKTSRGWTRMFIGGSDDMIHNWTLEGLAEPPMKSERLVLPDGPLELTAEGFRPYVGEDAPR